MSLTDVRDALERLERLMYLQVTAPHVMSRDLAALKELAAEYASQTSIPAQVEMRPGGVCSMDGTFRQDDVITVVEGIHLVGVHDPSRCAGQACVIHNQLDHHMRSWTLHWRDDRGIFERICPTHGVGHPDPSQFEYWESIDRMCEAVHGCCGCCRTT